MGAVRKPCRSCGGEKPPGERLSYCSETCREAGRQQRRERFNAYCAERYLRVREAALAAQRERRQTDPEFREAVDRRAREWRLAHPEETADQRRRRVRLYRDRKRGHFIEHVEPLVVLERDDGVCGICGGDVDPFDFHVDHIVPMARGGEHSYRNVQAAHPRCNKSKGARLLEPISPSLED